MKTLIIGALGLLLALPASATIICTNSNGVIICQQYNTTPNTQVYPQPNTPPQPSKPGQFIPSPYYPQPFYNPNQGQ